jgi:type IV pilus assembly protein PilC
MPEFIARVGSADGSVTERAFTADSEEALRADLAGREYLVFTVRRKGGAADLLPDFGRRRTVKMKEFLLFNQELAALIRAGLPIIAGLDILLERRKNPAFRKALADVRDRVRGGEALSEAFDAQGGLFPKIYSATLASGERSGEVANVLQRYIAYQKKILALKRKVVSSLIYPAILCALSIAVIVILITYVVPSFTSFLLDFGTDLPLLTRILIALSGFVTGYWLALLGAVAGGALAARTWARTAAGRLQVDRLIVRIPVLGGIWHRFAVSRFLRTLGTLVSGGIPVVTALGISAQAVGNRQYERILAGVERKVREGGSLWQSLEQTGLFSDIAIEMTKVGESTGSLHDMLTNAADFYDEEIDSILATVMVMLEPVLLIAMGLMVALIMLAIWMPLLTSYSQSGG